MLTISLGSVVGEQNLPSSRPVEMEHPPFRSMDELEFDGRNVEICHQPLAHLEMMRSSTTRE